MDNESFFSVYTPNYTKFQGLIRNKYKYMDFIGVNSKEKVRRVIVNNKAFLVKGREIYGLNNDVLFYYNKKDKEVIIDLDFRHINEFPVWGRYYNIERKDKYIVVNYILDGKEEKQLFIAMDQYEILKEEWINKKYEYDKQRHSKYDLWVYRIKVRSNGYIAISVDKDKALFNLYKINDYLKAISKKNREIVKLEQDMNKLITDLRDKHFIDKRDKVVIKKLLDELRYSIATLNHGYFLAGYPFFLEEWYRDELIAMNSLKDKELWATTIKRIFPLVREAITSNDYRIRTNPYSNLKSCDAPYYFWCGLINYLEEFGVNEYLSLIEAREMLSYLPKFLEIAEKTGIEKLNIALPFCNKKESWIDTCSCGCREGITIENALMHLKLYEALLKIKNNELLSDILNHSDLEEKTRKVIEHYYSLFKPIRDAFPDRNFITPSIFLGLYFATDVLPRREIDNIIRVVIPDLWLEWGGLSSISKKHQCFNPYATGEDNKSYHSGDSWYFLNNIAAIVMYRLNPDRYKHYIWNILKASINDLFNLGLYMYSSEISSAAIQCPQGAHAQLWSMTTLYELLSLILEHSISD